MVTMMKGTDDEFLAAMERQGLDRDLIDLIKRYVREDIFRGLKWTRDWRDWDEEGLMYEFICVNLLDWEPERQRHKEWWKKNGMGKECREVFRTRRNNVIGAMGNVVGKLTELSSDRREW